MNWKRFPKMFVSKMYFDFSSRDEQYSFRKLYNLTCNVDISQSPMTVRPINDLKKALYAPWPSDSHNAFGFGGLAHHRKGLDR
jgi:hypothetical protein